MVRAFRKICRYARVAQSTAHQLALFAGGGSARDLGPGLHTGLGRLFVRTKQCLDAKGVAKVLRMIPPTPRILEDKSCCS